MSHSGPEGNQKVQWLLVGRRSRSLGRGYEKAWGRIIMWRTYLGQDSIGARSPVSWGSKPKLRFPNGNLSSSLSTCNFKDKIQNFKSEWRVLNLQHGSFWVRCPVWLHWSNGCGAHAVREPMIFLFSGQCSLEHVSQTLLPVQQWMTNSEVLEVNHIKLLGLFFRQR